MIVTRRTRGSVKKDGNNSEMTNIININRLAVVALGSKVGTAASFDRLIWLKPSCLLFTVVASFLFEIEELLMLGV